MRVRASEDAVRHFLSVPHPPLRGTLPHGEGKDEKHTKNRPHGNPWGRRLAQLVPKLEGSVGDGSDVDLAAGDSDVGQLVLAGLLVQDLTDDDFGNDQLVTGLGQADQDGGAGLVIQLAGLGAQSVLGILGVVVDNGDRLIVRIPTVSLTDEQRNSLCYGAKMYITFEGKVMHFFNPETELNLLS